MMASSINMASNCDDRAALAGLANGELMIACHTIGTAKEQQISSNM
jgi:hypothetical protein